MTEFLFEIMSTLILLGCVLYMCHLNNKLIKKIRQLYLDITEIETRNVVLQAKLDIIKFKNNGSTVDHDNVVNFKKGD